MTKHKEYPMNSENTLPRVNDVLRFGDGAECTVQSVGKPLASGRFRGMHVVVCMWSTGRQGSFIAEVSQFTKVSST